MASPAVVQDMFSRPDPISTSHRKYTFSLQPDSPMSPYMKVPENAERRPSILVDDIDEQLSPTTTHKMKRKNINSIFNNLPLAVDRVTIQMTQRFESLKKKAKQNPKDFDKPSVWQMLCDTVMTFATVAYEMNKMLIALGTCQAQREKKMSKPEEPIDVETAFAQLTSLITNIQMLAKKLCSEARRLVDQGVSIEDLITVDTLLELDPYLQYAVDRSLILEKALSSQLNVKSAAAVMVAAVRWKNKTKLSKSKVEG